MFGLDPDSVIRRIRSSGQPVVLPDRKQSMLVGGLGFGVVSLVVFGLWALAGRWLVARIGTIPFYSVLAVGFMAGGPAAFKPVLIGENLRRFYVLFLGSFLIYSVIWIVCWSKWGHAGEGVASVVGPAAMGGLFVGAFDARARWIPCLSALVIGHTVGYFAGSLLFAWEPLHTRIGMEIWGLLYGAGFGAGIGFALSECQSETRARLLEMRSKSPPVNSVTSSDSNS